jgi:hypothetical protein
MPIYSVQAPDGSIIDIEGPDGASEAQILQAAQAAFGGQAQPQAQPETTAAGLAGSATRGLAPIAAGAALGAAAGAPFAGVGAIPGALAGAGAAGLAQLVGDPLVSGINSLLGTRYKAPSDAMADLLTRLGVPQADTEAERIVQSIAGGAAGSAGIAAGGKAIQQLASLRSDALQKVGRFFGTSPALQTISGGTAGGAAQIAAEMGASPGEQLAAGLVGGIAPSVPGLVKESLGAAARALSPKGSDIRAATLQTADGQVLLRPKEPSVKESLQIIGAPLKEKARPAKTAQIRETLVNDPASVDVVNYRLSGKQVLPDGDASETIKQGWKDGVIAAVKAATDRDRQAMTEMLNIYKRGKKNEKFRTNNRPADVLGESIKNRIYALSSQRTSAGEMLGRVAKEQLKGARVDVQPAINQFLSDLAEIGVRVEFDNKGLAKAVLQGSEIEGDKAGQELLDIVLKRLSATESPDAFKVHTAKRFIDSQVQYGKKPLANPLTAQAERVVKRLRKNLNSTIGDINPDYKAANARFEDTTDALADIQKAVGTSVNFNDENAAKALGTAARKLTSNYASRANMISALGKANETAAKYGAKFNDDIVNQVIFANELDRMFGAAADTSLKGQMEQAAKSGLTAAKEAARGGGGLTERAINLAAMGLERARGINEENAIKAMEQILRRRSNTPSTSREVVRFAGNRTNQ